MKQKDFRAIERVSFPELDPCGVMPRGVDYVTCEDKLPEALKRIDGKERDVVIWRFPWRDELLRQCASLDLLEVYNPSQSKISSAWPYNVGGQNLTNEVLYDLIRNSSAAPIVSKTFTAVAEALVANYPAALQDLVIPSTAVHATFHGYREKIHKDGTTLPGQLHATLALKGIGSWIVTRLQGGELLRTHVFGDIYAEDFMPRDAIYGVPAGDVAFWWADFPHSAVTILDPEKPRLVGVFSTKDNPVRNSRIKTTELDNS